MGQNIEQDQITSSPVSFISSFLNIFFDSDVK